MFLLTSADKGAIILSDDAKKSFRRKGERDLIYQKIFTDEQPYRVGMGPFLEFPEHRHADFEMNFCLSGGFDIMMDKKSYRVEAGHVTFIPSMCSHAVPSQEGDRNVITIIVGMALLKKYFNEFSHLASAPAVYDLNKPEMQKIRELFWECVAVLRSEDEGVELLLTGNVYKIAAYLLQVLSNEGERTISKVDLRKVENVEKALDLIHYHYKEPITVEYAAEITGYSKSNFCKIFKKVVGESFHQALNRRRADNAAGLLKASDMSVADIATEVGFSESKAFCRVFKSVYGKTPGEYRKSK